MLEDSVIPESGIASDVRSRMMRAVKRTDTKPEIAVRSALHQRGYRFRKDFPIRVDGRVIRPDVVFTRQRIAVFVDGCFWHVCPLHCRRPRTNTEFWSQKLGRNQQRDREQDAALEKAGWVVVRIWEHQTIDSAVSDVVAVVR
ncbi:very short patch repair endonuclease [Rhodococcus sp. IEGM1428]|uniref:very short patch repair endonuclease n=1 Tax=Rhodococcus sp. IEGM1428 TaxID=3392191 RepID=UPI003D0AF5CE